jgi:hypothetical protein
MPTDLPGPASRYPAHDDELFDAAEEAVVSYLVGCCRLTLSNPVLKAPGMKRLKLWEDELLSNFAFNLNLRRYNLEEQVAEHLVHYGIPEDAQARGSPQRT